MIPRGFDIHARMQELEADYERGRQRFAELPEIMHKLSKEGETLMRSLARIEGAMTVLREMGARTSIGKEPAEDSEPEKPLVSLQ